MMNKSMLFKTTDGNVIHENGKLFDTASCAWMDSRKNNDNQLIKISIKDAIQHIQAQDHPFRCPVAVVGTHEPTDKQYEIAEEIGVALSYAGLSVICGGRLGIMEAVCKGVAKNNGVSIGILPESTLENANRYVSIPIPTGLGFARNSVIAASALAMIAIGNGYGTTSEVAYGLMFGKKVFSIESTINLDGVINCLSTNELLDGIYTSLLSL